jgi:hypothetical protein
MTQRKVGQDMVVRKKSSQQVVVPSRTVSQSRETSVIKNQILQFIHQFLGK